MNPQIRAEGLRVVFAAACLVLPWTSCGGNQQAGGENNPDRCADGVDNDSDGKIDCADPECIVLFAASLCSASKDLGVDQPPVGTGEEEHPGTDADGDGWALEWGDCNDKNASIHPAAPEKKDGIDNNCNGEIDEELGGGDPPEVATKLMAGTNYCYAVAFQYPVGTGAAYTHCIDGDKWYVYTEFQRKSSCEFWQGTTHLGEDWNTESGGDTDLGSPVYSIADGVVVISQQYGPTWGKVIVIRHDAPPGSSFALPDGGIVDHVYSQYAHLQNLLVADDAPVKMGQKIAEIGPRASTSTSAHLHWEMSTPSATNIPGPAYYLTNIGRVQPSGFVDMNLVVVRMCGKESQACCQPLCDGGKATCNAGLSCSNGTCQKATGCTTPCTPGATRCSGNKPETCQGDGCTWIAGQSCSCGCINGSCTTQLCTPAAKRCSGKVPETCQNDGCGWLPGQVCTCGCSNGNCTTQLCAPGAKRCNGNVPETCQNDGCGWTAGQSCSCGCAGGVCTSQACAPGAARCNGSTIEVCQNDGCSWTAGQSCSCGCSNGSCLGTTCTPGATRCSGNAVETCRNDGCGWNAPVACPSNGACNSTSGCYHIEASPSVGLYTADFLPDTNCTCPSSDCSSNSTCHALWRGKVVSIDSASNTATMEFMRADGGAAVTATLDTWIAVTGDPSPSCTQNQCVAIRWSAANQWPIGMTRWTSPSVSIWPSKAALDGASCGTTTMLYLITDGSGVLNQKVWLQKQPFIFTKICP